MKWTQENCQPLLDAANAAREVGEQLDELFRLRDSEDLDSARAQNIRNAIPDLVAAVRKAEQLLLSIAMYDEHA